jgi:hypothetical protein
VRPSALALLPDPNGDPVDTNTKEGGGIREIQLRDHGIVGETREENCHSSERGGRQGGEKHKELLEVKWPLEESFDGFEKDFEMSGSQSHRMNYRKPIKPTK